MKHYDEKEKQFTVKLIQWGKRNKRIFPWREKDRNAYQILIAELFLKRTTSSHVIKVYETFIKKYSRFEDIIKTDSRALETELHSLGLQKQRVKQLKQLSNYIVDFYDGSLPKNERKLLTIPGIGQYTSRALLCFAFNKRSYPVDSNVQRVIARVFLDTEWKKTKIERIEEVFIKIQPRNNFKAFNYYILDFGSTVCRPSYPKCNYCPISNFCLFLKQNKENEGERRHS